MATVYADRVADTTSTPGTAAFALDGSSFNGYRAFSAVCSDGDVIYYAAQHRTLNQWEVGQGTYGAGTGVLTRTTILSSSNSGSAVNFSSGTKDIVGTIPAALFSSIQVLNNVRVAKTAAYTLANTENGKTVALGGSAFYTLTVNAASGYDTTFMCVVLNEDTGRGKRITINAGDNFILWPGQSIILYKQNTAWRVLGRQRWHPPAGALNFYVNPSLGNQNNDGLATGSGAFASCAQAIYRILSDMDLTDWSAVPLSGQVQATINLADSSTDTEGVHWSPHGAVGAQGGAAITIAGGTNSIISATGVEAIGTYFGSVIRLKNLTLRSNVNIIHAQWGSQIYIEEGIVLGGGGVTPTGAMMLASRGSHIEWENGTVTIAGNSTYGFQASSRGGITTGGQGVTFSTNVTFSQSCVYAADQGLVDFGGTTINLGGNTVTGTRFQLDGDGRIKTGTGGASLTYFPGTVAGSFGRGSTYDTLSIESKFSGHGDSDYTILGTDLPFLGTTAALTATRTWTLPLANTCPPGAELVVVDYGGIGGGNNLVIQAGGTDSFVGTGVAANAITLSSAYAAITVRGNGDGVWIRVA